MDVPVGDFAVRSAVYGEGDKLHWWQLEGDVVQGVESVEVADA
jgi:hypothetical protein